MRKKAIVTLLPCYQSLEVLILLDFIVTKGITSLQKGCDFYFKRCTT